MGYLWSTCGPMELGPAFFEIPTNYAAPRAGRGPEKGGWGSPLARGAGLGWVQLPGRAGWRGPRTPGRARKIALVVARLWCGCAFLVDGAARLI